MMVFSLLAANQEHMLWVCLSQIRASFFFLPPPISHTVLAHFDLHLIVVSLLLSMLISIQTLSPDFCPFWSPSNCGFPIVVHFNLYPNAISHVDLHPNLISKCCSFWSPSKCCFPIVVHFYLPIAVPFPSNCYLRVVKNAECRLALKCNQTVFHLCRKGYCFPLI